VLKLKLTSLVCLFLLSGIYLQDLEAIDRASEFSTPQVPADLPPLPEGVVPGPLINAAKARQRAKM